MTYGSLDPNFSRAAERRARETRSHLFLYSPYAWEAFTAKYVHTPRKVLFQYHPHPEIENRILTSDVRKFPEVERSFSESTGNDLPEALQKRVSECWREADLIICASTFTMQSLLEAGAQAALCKVVPYGVEFDRSSIQDANNTQRTFRVLFVGSGIQRKGLHHLLRAWASARLPEERELVLVCRNLDPGLEERVAKTPNVRLHRGMSYEMLTQLYRTSSLLAMPSLTEGFGQVFLEALSFGCPVLGTGNTCLPDLGGETNGIFTVEAGNLDHLTHELERLSELLPANTSYRLLAREQALRFTWPRFRSEINALL